MSATHRDNITSPSPSSSSANSPSNASSGSYSYRPPSSASSLHSSSSPSAVASAPRQPSKTAEKPPTRTAADQPLTIHGKPRERVYLACLQCRNRKVRCDGAKPECLNCVRRLDPTLGQCSYDAAPRRRGKDRTPGSRKMAPFQVKKTRTTRSRLEEEEKRKKAASAQHSAAPPTEGVEPPASTSRAGRPGSMNGLIDIAPVASSFESISRPRDLRHAPSDGIAIYQRVEEEDDSQSRSTISTPPGVQFTRETWWDALLALYAPDGGVLTAHMREVTTSCIVADLRFLFHVSMHWFSFLNIPRFFASVFDPYRRHAVQPSLIMSALALATFFQSSELERGASGRVRAFALLDQAHATFDASLSSGWIDVGLVQAAWLLAMFEIQAHPQCSTPRTRSAFTMLDSLIRSLSLTSLDIGNPRTSRFVPGAVPIVRPTASAAPYALFSTYGAADVAQPGTRSFPMTGLETSVGIHDFDGSRALAQMASAGANPLATGSGVGGGEAEPGPCGCSAYSLGYHWPMAQELAPAWTNMPMWPREGEEGQGEVLKEECRRVVWSTVMLTASHSTKTTAGTDRESMHLWIKDPANYALLFPGESLTSVGMGVGFGLAFSKDSMWALYVRTLFLWHSCFRARCDESLSDADRAQYAVDAWLEIDNVEAAIDRHTCGIQSGFMLQMREILFNTRMVISNEFRRYIPQALTTSGKLFYHQRAEKWMRFMLHLANNFRKNFYQPNGESNDNTRRCFLIYWFMSQIMRSLALWYADPTLTIALEVAKAFAPCVEYMMMIWPSQGQRKEYEALRNWLVRSCQRAGLTPPTREIPVVAPPPLPAQAAPTGVAMDDQKARPPTSKWSPSSSQSQSHHQGDESAGTSAFDAQAGQPLAHAVPGGQFALYTQPQLQSATSGWTSS